MFWFRGLEFRVLGFGPEAKNPKILGLLLLKSQGREVSTDLSYVYVASSAPWDSLVEQESLGVRGFGVQGFRGLGVRGFRV